MRAIVPMLLAAALSLPIAAQTLSEQLQKGIYTEETLGNRDEAARIYREIIAAPSVPQSIADEAQRRLARLLLASQQQAERDSRQPPLVPAFPGQPRGAVEQGRYRHYASGITFDPPVGWTVGTTRPSSDNGDMVTVMDRATGMSINVWMIKQEIPAAQMAVRAAAAPARKLEQRHSGYGIPGMRDARTYDIPQDTVQPAQINGRPAMFAIGKYHGAPPTPVALPGGEYSMQWRQNQPLQPMNEYMAWIYGERSRAFFFARVLADDLPLLRPVFDQFVNSAVVP